ncbi:hypothetical protein D0B54_17935 [Solimonas sp. K1W22B-7]|uniref:hypothetical protein n=1 Tax=Solimonas sp. K1W22B-7 TaxID=2303331 RepID=UPI000E335F5B|nr:hypothetical protein [Solimonas sp. K1W22B-7]AXQ30441.1 hypothetical protein D0B54_17935 [Solimonas sp. K1W22B-7]
MSQLKRKFVEDNAINGAKIRLDNNEMLRGRNAANSGDIDILKITSANELELQVQPKAAPALAMPSADKDYVTVEYVQNVINGKQDPKEAVDVLAMGNLALTGATPLLVDGRTILHGDAIGLVGQADASQNGPYLAALDGGSYTLTRRADFDQDAEVSKGAYFPVTNGTQYAGYQVILTTENPIEVGVTPLNFVAYPSVLSIEAGDMLAKVGNTLSVDLAALSGLESTNAGNASGQLRVKTDTAAAEKDQTTRRDPVSGATVAKRSRRHAVTLSPTDIGNQYVDLPDVAAQDSVRLAVAGAGEQLEGDDYSVNYTGGASSKTRVSFAGGLATAGVSALVSGDKLAVYYRAF